MINCKICGKNFNSIAKHIVGSHHISYKEYFDTYIKIGGYCAICNKPTKFYRNKYNICCSQHCAAKFRNIHKDYTKEIYDFELANNCTSCSKLRHIYGQGWYKANIIDTYIKATFGCFMHFVHNEDIDKIIEYVVTTNKSRVENDLFIWLQSFNLEILHNNRSKISPYELDFYIPEKNIAIEYNGSWFHSIENGCDAYYHYNKSKMCKEKGIRLIHMYEFEKLDIQKQLLTKLLIDNIDEYGMDANKNNLLFDELPKPYCQEIDRGYHIYTVGKLLERKYSF